MRHIFLLKDSDRSKLISSFLPFLVVMLVRKQCENPTDYFDKTFAEYQEGFSANGEFQKDDKMTENIFQERSGLAWTSFIN